MALVLIRVSAPFFFVPQIFGYGLCRRDPVASDLPGTEFPAHGQQAEMSRAESGQGRGVLERDELLAVQRPSGLFGYDGTL